jgi:hypothetical protein
MRHKSITLAGLTLVSCATLLADFQYEQTTKITGGFLAGMARFGGQRAMGPHSTTVAVQGNRIVRLTAQTADITDLDKETITHVDFGRKTYSVTTFEEMKQMMQAASQRMQERSSGQDSQSADVSFHASVKQTGQKKTVNAVDTKEYILIMAMNATDTKTGQSGAINITNDMWMAPEVPGYQEIRDFERRMAEKMGDMTQGGMNPMMGMRPGMSKGLAEMAKEMSKLKGTPVIQVTRMGSTPDGKPLPAASEAPELSQQSQPNMGDAAGKASGDAAGNVASGTAGSALGGKLGGLAGMGGLGGFGKKKRQDPAQDQDQQQQPPAGGGAGGMLMETTTEMSSFASTPVDPLKFEVPAGFKQEKRERGRSGR